MSLYDSPFSSYCKKLTALCSVFSRPRPYLITVFGSLRTRTHFAGLSAGTYRQQQGRRIRVMLTNGVLTGRRRTLTVTDRIRFDDGAAYERYMGEWSRLAGETFLGWLAPRPGLRWLDVGCGNGAFTELLAGRCAPLSVHGIDPSEAQLAYALSAEAFAGLEE